MYVSYKQLVEMANLAYVTGQSCTLDMKDQIVEEIINDGKLGAFRELRVFSIEELKLFPAGTVFHHSLLGRGEVITKKGVRQPFIKFDNGVTHAFSADAFPWDLPMLLDVK